MNKNKGVPGTWSVVTALTVSLNFYTLAGITHARAQPGGGQIIFV
jgi:hypothetical protein